MFACAERREVVSARRESFGGALVPGLEDDQLLKSPRRLLEACFEQCETVTRNIGIIYMAKPKIRQAQRCVRQIRPPYRSLVVQFDQPFAGANRRDERGRCRLLVASLFLNSAKIGGGDKQRVEPIGVRRLACDQRFKDSDGRGIRQLRGAEIAASRFFAAATTVRERRSELMVEIAARPVRKSRVNFLSG